MPVFIVIIVFSLAAYVYYKIKFFKTKKEIEKKWLSAKSSIALGLFVFFFGINRIFITQTTVTVIIGIIFIIIGGFSIYTGFKAYKFYLPHILKEREQM
ncbi:YtpI family protein [Pallidibacillus pasinlerensis]|uniref:YtpI-like protein n=1 Tax=Pallidibacillus pasinlerensis TaxID=2703818 RepID=A0ABX0A3T3_9BACI|nr:YtpI family protein [Pallidibacillus pasinlerensis]NCU18072.1 hypothetical protein [Pallidibacillus pasinlerensis]